MAVSAALPAPASHPSFTEKIKFSGRLELVDEAVAKERATVRVTDLFHGV